MAPIDGLAGYILYTTPACRSWSIHLFSSRRSIRKSVILGEGRERSEQPLPYPSTFKCHQFRASNMATTKSVRRQDSQSFDQQWMTMDMGMGVGMGTSTSMTTRTLTHVTPSSISLSRLWYACEHSLTCSLQPIPSATYHCHQAVSQATRIKI